MIESLEQAQRASSIAKELIKCMGLIEAAIPVHKDKTLRGRLIAKLAQADQAFARIRDDLTDFVSRKGLQ